MKRVVRVGIAITFVAGLAVPAQAVGVGDLAKVILGGSSVLKKGQEKCGSSLGLTTQDSLALTVARAAAERALPRMDFQALDSAANKDAEQQSQATGFCNETKAKKPGLMGTIKKAGKSILKSAL